MMKKYLTYTLILIALVGILGPTTKINADSTGTCNDVNIQVALKVHAPTVEQEQAWCASQNNGAGGLFTKNTLFPDTCSNLLNWTSTSCTENKGNLVSNTGQMCISLDNNGNNTPSGCDATVNVSGSSCTVSQSWASKTWGVMKHLSFFPNAAFDWVNNFDNSCGSSGGRLDKKTAGLSTCTFPNWSPASCQQNSGAYYPPGVTPGTVPPIDTSNYTLLAPLPDGNGGQLSTFNSADNNALGGYLNLMIKIFIGLCAVLAVVMIVVGGIEWMTTELPGEKADGKGKITGAIFGLLLALVAWTLLNTINPSLLKTDLSSIKNATVYVAIKSFNIPASGPQSRNGKAIKIDFNSQAYPAAVTAQTKTGVDPALVLAIFNQETSGGANTGACFPANANMTTADQTALASIVGQNQVATTHVSCSLSSGHGGAIGLTQFLPSTWITTRDSPAGKAAFGNSANQGHGTNGAPDPWNTQDALMMTAVYLQNKGATTDPASEQQAACSYFGSCSSSGVNYGDQVMAQVTSIKQQISTAKTNGTIK